MYTTKELCGFNNVLLGRGMPTFRDNMGYNKPDYSVCSYYFDIMSDTQLADLAERLVKYCYTQLDASKEKMKETANYYNAKVANTSLENSISLSSNTDDGYVLLSFKYNQSFIDIIKRNSNDRSFLPLEKAWKISVNEVLKVLKALKDVGADVDNVIDYVQGMDNISTTTTKVSVEDRSLSNKITVLKENKKTLEVSFDYNAEVVNAVKKLMVRKYNGMPSKSWTIEKDEVNDLITNLQGVDINIAELQKYATVKCEAIVEIMDVSHLNPTPFKHQIQAGQFLLKEKKAILADEMGGGKTKSSILAGNSLEGLKIIVCPASLKINWMKEIKQVNPNAKVNIINGSEWVNPVDGSWTIINYDVLSKHIKKINSTSFVCLIADEVHYIKSVTNAGKAGSKRAEMLLEIADNTEYVFFLTGTPIPNHTKDVYNLLKGIKHPLSKNFFAFGQRYCGADHNGYGWDFNGSSNREELHEKIKGKMLRRLKEDLLDLPEKIRSFIPASINLREYMMKVDEYMNNRNSLQSNGEHLVYLNALRHILAKEKVSSTIDMIENFLEQDKPVVVFSCYNFVIEEIMKKFGDDAVKITGSDSSVQRQNAVDLFQNGKKMVIACNIVAGGVGITLTNSQIVIFNDYDWLPANHSQAEDRIHRIGQKNNCNIYYMYASGAEIDESITTMLDEKLKNISKIVDGEEVSFVDEVINSFKK